MDQINKQLEVLKAFQTKYPKSHVGGSIGLFLLGIDLKRNLYYSDLDITTPEFIEKINNNTEPCSPVQDYQYRYKINHNKSGHYFKLEIRIDTEQNDYVVVNYKGVNYNVSKKENILSWKQKYAEKGSIKHVNDLITIATGVRPINLDYGTWK